MSKVLNASNNPDARFQAITRLKIWADNYNHGDVEAIALSIRRFGFNNALRVWRDDVVMAGNHTLQALRLIQQEGPRPDVDQAWPPANVVVDGADWLVLTVDVSHLNALEAKAFAIADNRLAREAVTDDALLAQYLKEIADHEQFLVQAAGYNDVAFQEMMHYLTSDIVPDDFPEYDETIASTVKTCTCPNCGHVFVP